ncbi:MAG: ECF transporter S component [Clostridia bacterium]|nr:ECF transporter S component [Clostridia bacterium]
MEETTNQDLQEQQAEQETDAKAEAVKPKRAEYFTATRIAYIAIFTALSTVLRFFQFSVLPAVPYLQVDFSDVFVLICGYSLGPVAGVISLVLKEFIYGLIGTKTMFVGELANILITLPMLLITSLIYKKHKGIIAVIVGMVIACVVRVAWCFPVNWLLNFPVFVGFDWTKGMKMFIKVWYWAMLFNLIKTVILAAAVMLLYKPLSLLIKKTNEKFASVKGRRKNNSA